MLFSVLVSLSIIIGLPKTLEATCPADWETHQGNCYKKFAKASFTEAQRNCENQDASLVEVRDKATNDYLKNTFKDNIWLGVTGCGADSFCYVSFGKVTYDNWGINQPNKEPIDPMATGQKDYGVVMRRGGRWFDEPKSKEYAYVCTRPDDLCKKLICNDEGSVECKNDKCVCNPGYSGKECYTYVCDPNPCQNGGTCGVENGNYKCTCANFYSGKNCEVPPPCEAKKPCKNNGVCTDLSTNDYKCSCTGPWTGKNCDEQPCDSNPCKKAKECINNNDGTYKCICLPGWTGVNCDKYGGASGDPHYTTFDGKKYDFMGKCEYVYAKDCRKEHAFEVLQQNEACGGGTVSCTKSIRVFVQGMEIHLERGKIVYVDGVRVTLPWTKPGSTTKITSYANGAFLNVPDLIFSVKWDGSMYINVGINQRYQAHMCGLMGDADGNPNNDFKDPKGNVLTNIADFGNSWKKNPRCVNGIVPEDPCLKLTQAKRDEIKAKCGKMKEPPFQNCNDVITPDIGYIPNCEYDLCAMKENPSAAYCRALDTYTADCRIKNVIIQWEGQAGFEECGNPCAEMPCFNGAECRNINREQYECICPAGFTGTTCENVECEPGYVARGSLCYKMMGRQVWGRGSCSDDAVFMTPDDEDENKFIYETFVTGESQSVWVNARGCGAGKVCKSDYDTVYYNNFMSQPTEATCGLMTVANNGKWSPKDCGAAYRYICKYEKLPTK